MRQLSLHSAARLLGTSAFILFAGCSTPSPSPTPTSSPPPADAGKVVALSAGDVFALALTDKGHIWWWGHELGDYSDSPERGEGATTPQLISGLPSISAIAAGSGYALAMDENGAVWAWGSNRDGKFGDGTDVSHATPTRISDFGQAIAVAAGVRQTMVLRGDGTIWAAGDNHSGTLGNGANDDSMTPVQAQVSDVMSIAQGTWHAMALDSGERVWTWGYNQNGQLGQGFTAWEHESAHSNSPLKVANLGNITAISAGSHSLALDSDGTVWAWGMDSAGQIGIGGKDDPLGTSLPTQVVGLPSIAAIAAGFVHSVAVAFDGTVWTWGDGQSDTFKSETGAPPGTPSQVPDLSDIQSVAAGNDFSIALKRDGSVWAWGDNSYGQLGNGTFASNSTPVKVLIPGTGSTEVGGNDGSDTTDTTAIQQILFARVLDPDTELAAMFFADGEGLAILGEKDATGNVTKLTGATYTDGAGNATTVWIDEAGLPHQMVINGWLLSFTEYDLERHTVHVTVRDATGSIVNDEQVVLTADALQDVNALVELQRELPLVAKARYAAKEDAGNLLSFGGRVVGVAGCVGAIILSAGTSGLGSLSLVLCGGGILLAATGDISGNEELVDLGDTMSLVSFGANPDVPGAVSATANFLDAAQREDAATLQAIESDECNQDAECASGFYCVEGQCQEGSLEPKPTAFSQPYLIRDGYHLSTLAFDYDRDGDLDLLVPGEGIECYYNNGHGEFSSLFIFQSESYIVGMRQADYNADGRTDFAIVESWERGEDFGQRLTTLMSQADGSFEKGPVLLETWYHSRIYLETADLDNDGDDDVVAAVDPQNSPSPVSYTSFINDGMGDLQSHASGAMATNNMWAEFVLKDLNGDAYPDMVVPSQASESRSNTLEVFANQGNGSFVDALQWPLGYRMYASCAEDLDGDGDMDLVSSGWTPNIYVVMNLGDWQFAEPVEFGTIHEGDDILCADLDMDGDIDVATPDHYRDEFYVFQNLGTGSFLAAEGYPVTRYSGHLILGGDFDGDGDVDIVIGNSAGLEIVKNLTVP